MSVTIEISNTLTLRRARSILGANSDSEAAELALEKFVESNETKLQKHEQTELSDEFWDDLFSQPKLPSSVIIKAINDEREDRF